MAKSLLHRLLCLAAAIACAAGATASAAAAIDPALEAALGRTAPDGQLEVVVTFLGDGPPDAEDHALLRALGLRGISLQALPIVGVTATPEHVRRLAESPSVRSVWLNARLEREPSAAGSHGRVDAVHALASDAGRMRWSGRGIGVLLNGHERPRHELAQRAAPRIALGNAELLRADRLQAIEWTESPEAAAVSAAAVAGSTVSSAVPGPGRVQGVAPGAEVIGYGPGTALFLFDVLGGFDYALARQFDFNIRVVANAFGNPADTGMEFRPHDPVNVATRALAERGMIVVFSAAPADAGAGTVTGNFKRAPWVLATGTSGLAAAELAGVVALLLEADPSLSWREVRDLLRKTARALDSEAAAPSGMRHAAAAMRLLATGAPR